MNPEEQLPLGAPKVMTENVRLTLLLLASSLIGCGSGDAGRQQTASQDTAFRATPIDSPSSTLQHPAGPVSVVADSSAHSARFEDKSGNAIVYLPTRMARLLSDSLPGFAPYSTAAYDSVIINLVAERDSTATLPSVVVGDFDGDGQSDVAMIGISRDSIAGVMLLTNAKDARGPMLLFMDRPRPSGSSRKSYVVLRIADKELIFKELKLHRDAVEEEAAGQGAIVFYVDRGVLRQLQTSD
jgi:hypothetical protein